MTNTLRAKFQVAARFDRGDCLARARISARVNSDCRAASLGYLVCDDSLLFSQFTGN